MNVNGVGYIFNHWVWDSNGLKKNKRIRIKYKNNKITEKQISYAITTYFFSTWTG